MKKAEIKVSPENDTDAERNLKIYKRDDLIQKARYSLSLTEQRFLLYAISKIQPNHDVSYFYDIYLGDFQKVCGTEENESYAHIKSWIKKLADKSWWVTEGRSETLIRWFAMVKLYPDSGMVRVKFHEEMFPYLFRLAEQMRETGKLYTSYAFRYVLPMKSTYSIRLYELLKSYQKNNTSWWFDLGKLKHLLDCENYTRFPDFRRFVLEPAIGEINQYTDISIQYSVVKEGRKVVAVDFTLLDKEFPELLQAHHDGLTELDGNTHYWDAHSKN